MNTRDLVAGALRLHQQGHLDQAESMYARVLAAEPAGAIAHADALHLMGVLRGQKGDVSGAIALIEQAISTNDRFSAYHNNLGNLRKRAGDRAGAEKSYRRAIQIDRSNADVHLNLGKLLEEDGNYVEARVWFSKALRLNPHSVEAQMSMGRLEEAQGNRKAALARYKEAARLAPRDAAPLLMYSKTLVALEQLQEAEASLRRLTALHPDFADGYYNLAVLLQRNERLPEAAELYRRVIELAPAGSVDAWNNLGVVLSKQGDGQGALAAFLQATELKPAFDGAFHNLGKEALKMGAEKAAEKYLRRALELNPRNAMALHDLGAMQQAQGLLAEAAESYRMAVECSAGLPGGASVELRANLEGVLALLGDATALPRFGEMLLTEQPDYADGRFNWSMALLLHGDYEAGFREYEWRRKVYWQKHNFRLEQAPQPSWDGSPLEGRTLLLTAEQGFGDTLQFIRYLPLVVARGGRIVLEVQPALKRLLQGLPGVEVCLALGDELPAFDLHLPLMSLPHVLQTVFVPPLAPPVPVLPRTGPDCRVGLVWAGNPGHSRDRLRSIGLEPLQPLAAVAGVRFVSLQAGTAALQAAEHGAPFRFVGDCSAVRDFRDTAEIIAGLDLVLTIDSAVAHLAGSMGKPVWVLVAHAPDWRWGFSGETTWWYPSARIFRQEAPLAWAPVVEQVTAELSRFACRVNGS